MLSSRSYLVFLFAHSIVAIIYQNGQMRLCDSSNPCPMGTACMYAPNIPGVQGCYEGVQKTKRHYGRCPVFTDGRQASLVELLKAKKCLFDENCPRSQRCCNFAVSAVYRFCVDAVRVMPEPQVSLQCKLSNSVCR